MHVLVVEDSYTQARIHELNLTRHGFEVVRANSLQDSISTLDEKAVDAVLLDLNLPDSRGIDTFYKIKDCAGEAPVVIVTSLADESNAISALQGGAQDYLIKGQATDAEIARCLLYAVERSRGEARLRRNEKRTRLILENSTDAFVTCNIKGVVKEWNRQAEILFGWSREEIIGKTLAETVIPPYLQDTHRLDLERLSKSYKDSFFRRRAELTLLARDGREIPVELGLFPIHLGENLDELCAFIHDISYRKQIEQRTKQLNEELEQRVQERTAELARSNAELHQFAKIASHDLQEPLRAVEGYAQLLARRYMGKLDEDGDEFINFILDGVDRMVKLIQSVLAHAAIGEDVNTAQFVDCKVLIQEVLEQLKPIIDESNAKIAVGSLPVIEGHRVELSQLFQNLLSNALKYRGGNLPEIHINAEENAHEWVFSVEDNGIGIDPRYTEKIFDMFARLHGKTSYSGTGIGLAICRKIVETHGGRIWVQSEPGNGSIFLFTLPHHQRPHSNLKQPSN